MKQTSIYEQKKRSVSFVRTTFNDALGSIRAKWSSLPVVNWQFVACATVAAFLTFELVCVALVLPFQLDQRVPIWR